MSEVLAKHVAQVLAAFGAIGTPHMQHRTWVKFGGGGVATCMVISSILQMQYALLLSLACCEPKEQITNPVKKEKVGVELEAYNQLRLLRLLFGPLEIGEIFHHPTTHHEDNRYSDRTPHTSSGRAWLGLKLG
jgi:hypothetical protein